MLGAFVAELGPNKTARADVADTVWRAAADLLVQRAVTGAAPDPVLTALLGGLDLCVAALADRREDELEGQQLRRLERLLHVLGLVLPRGESAGVDDHRNARRRSDAHAHARVTPPRRRCGRS